MGSCRSSKTHAQCDNCGEKTATALVFQSLRKRSSSRLGILNHSLRERLETEADQMADQFMNSRSKNSIDKPFSELRSTPIFSESFGNNILKKSLPPISQTQLPKNTLQLQSNEEETLIETPENEEKGGGGVW